ncbi:hypothetical protein BST81_12050 [Leptolyngbya sp. 'hensonii']|uniref:serine/threonine-protein kinase n=1 Tax=Leptolyngbya sp. 'hensonii' TaxID=1922337 RepID=UPI00094F52A3|nr:serine/threonine-protein kinase [Leptolyngbya sp. 'hensonii']OLP17796.1 hypothetical protein BST81_12050 [Leptolyngbya sp. 'hensonii']
MLETILSGRYKILRPLGSGGFGQTFLAEDLHLPGNFHCVVKQLKPQMSNPGALEVARTLFDREALVLHRLGDYDLIPRLYAHFEENQEFYLVQEFIEGEDLSRELLPGKQFSQPQVMELLQGILEILDYVHQQDVIHRDIKPSNLIRRKRDSKVVMIDFGAVKQISAQTINPMGQTSLTVAIGSPGYMPNEQYSGKPRFCSDIYAVGMIGIQALTGISPGKLPEDVLTGEILWRDQLQTPISPSLAAILDKMVCYDFRQRYQTVKEVLQALKSVAPACSSTIAYPAAEQTLPPPSEAPPQREATAALSGSELPSIPPLSQQETQPVPEPQTTPGQKLRRRMGMAIAASAVVAIGATGVYGHTQWQEQQRLQTTLNQSRSAKTAAKYQDCVNQAKLVPTGSYLHAQAQTLLHECLFFQAKQLASNGKLKDAIAAAVQIPAASAMGQAATKSLEEWATALLKQATEQYRAGKLENAVALAQVIPTRLTTGKTAQGNVTRWKKEWTENESRLKAAQKALDAGEPQKALDETAKIAKTPFWEKKMAVIVQKAQDKLAVAIPASTSGSSTATPSYPNDTSGSGYEPTPASYSSGNQGYTPPTTQTYTPPEPAYVPPPEPVYVPPAYTPPAYTAPEPEPDPVCSGSKC